MYYVLFICVIIYNYVININLLNVCRGCEAIRFAVDSRVAAFFKNTDSLNALTGCGCRHNGRPRCSLRKSSKRIETGIKMITC
jgi:hypothetical protein